MAMQHGSLMSVMKYENVRDYAINVATRKAAMSTPKPMDVDQVWNWNEWKGGRVMQVQSEGKGGSEEDSWGVDAVKGKSKGKGKTCYNCGVARTFCKGVSEAKGRRKGRQGRKGRKRKRQGKR